MPKKREKWFFEHDKNMPQWYWDLGLHDACITQVECFEYPYDYYKYDGVKNKNDRNMLRLKIDADGALYDRYITEIRLFNYEVLTTHVRLKGRESVWWISDCLTASGNGYLLEIDLQDLAASPTDFTFKIKFDRAEVDRNV